MTLDHDVSTLNFNVSLLLFVTKVTTLFSEQLLLNPSLTRPWVHFLSCPLTTVTKITKNG